MVNDEWGNKGASTDLSHPPLPWSVLPEHHACLPNACGATLPAPLPPLLPPCPLCVLSGCALDFLIPLCTVFYNQPSDTKCGGMFLLPHQPVPHLSGC